MKRTIAPHPSQGALEAFLRRQRRPRRGGLPALSLFSGGGLSDFGYSYAGFDFVVHAEKDPSRAELCQANYPSSKVIVGDLRKKWKDVVREYERASGDRPALLSVTPPCQGMSSSNPGRGKVCEPDKKGQNERNLLLLAAVPVVETLRPKCVVVENVPQILIRMAQLSSADGPKKLVDVFFERLRGYEMFCGVVQMADYGIPQVRRRSVMVLLDKDLSVVGKLKSSGLLPWPKPTHAETPNDGQQPWLTLKEWFGRRGYARLDARGANTSHDSRDPLHFVPHYDEVRYSWVSGIPANSGKSAYENDECPHCGRRSVPLGEARCPACGEVMTNRPHVKERNGTVRLVRGFRSSYRRMRPNRPAPTVTTASSHLGSDYKIHPWENRVLSIRECVDLQTVPPPYRWDWATKREHYYLIREVVGEAIPPWFTYLHGKVLKQLLKNEVPRRRLARRQESK